MSMDLSQSKPPNPVCAHRRRSGVSDCRSFFTLPAIINARMSGQTTIVMLRRIASWKSRSRPSG